MARHFSMKQPARGAALTPDSARELLSIHLGANPYDGVEKLRAIGEQKAQAEGVAYQMEKEREVVLARIANELANIYADEKMSEAKLDRLARADPRYGAHLKATAEAIEKRELANSDYWGIVAELKWDEESMRHSNAMSRLDR